MAEKEFLAQAVQLARLCGWLCYHTLDSRGSAGGFPDLVLVKGRRVVWAELKSESGRLSPGQESWRDRLLAAGQEWYCWRPSDWPEIGRVLGP